MPTVFELHVKVKIESKHKMNKKYNSNLIISKIHENRINEI